MALTVVFGSAIICSGALAASSYKGAIQRGLVMALYAASALGSGMVGLGFCAMRSDGCGFFYHFNAIGFILCYVMLGLVMARSRIRLTVHQYEVKPSWMVIGLLIFTPMVVGMATLVSFGWLGGLGFIAMGIVSRYADVTPKGPNYLGQATSNVPNIPLNPHHIPEAPELKKQVVEPVESVEKTADEITDTTPSAEEKIDILKNLPKTVPKKPVKAYPKVDKEKYDGWR